MTAPLAPVGLRLARVERELLAESAKARTAAMVAAQKRHDGFVKRVLDDARDRAGLVAGVDYAFAFADDFSAVTFTPTGAQTKAPEAPPEAVLPVPPSLKGAAKARALALDDSLAPSPPATPGGPT